MPHPVASEPAPPSPSRWIPAFARRLGAWLAPLPPYPVASIVALALACGLEAIFVPGPRTAVHLGALGGIAIAVGALHGWLWQLAFALLGRVRKGYAWAVVATAALAGASWLADVMGVSARLGSHYDELARIVLVVCVLGGSSLGTLVALLRPSTGAPRGALGRLGTWPTVVVVVLLLAVAGGLAYADLTLYVGLYLDAHFALRLCAVWALVFAIVLGARGRWLPALRGRGWLVVVLAAAGPLVTLRDDTVDSVQAFVTRPWSATLLRVARGLVDLDRDGYSALLAGGDCDDLDARVHPAAREIRGNGVDDNCAFGDARAVATDPAEVPIPTSPSPMNVVLVSVDCLRWDRLGINHRKGQSVTPKLSAWATRAVNFKRAYTPGAWTSIAVGSMLRGMYARKLEWTAYYETSYYRLLRNPRSQRLGEDERVAKMFPVAWHDPHWPLPRWLKRRGMQTIAVVDDGFSQMLSKSLNVGDGFDVYREVAGEPNADPDAFLRARFRMRRSRTQYDDAATATAAISSIRWSGKGKNFFAWVHFFGPHTPSIKHDGVRSDGKSVEQEYDHEIRYLDQQLDRLLTAVDELEMPTAVFVTADHGEKFFKGYRSHGADLSEDVLRVPLLARVPGWAPANVDVPVSLVDLAPTILALTGTPAPPDLDGIDLARTLDAKASGGKVKRRSLFADTWQYDRQARNALDLVAAFDGRHKVVLDRGSQGLLAYDQRDPAARPLRIEGLAVDRLVRAAAGYLEESGGALSLER